ncbi:glycosyltransferase [Amycolatopsis sp. NPDC059027]|uniref:glycosyltransferase n=1 Tax=unclassified Amycolatopsis TaxID=2618356 RepID=UPI00367247F7
MRVLLSTVGTRGDVQPLVTLASQLEELGGQVRICAPPDFRDWITGLGIPFAPLGSRLDDEAAGASVAWHELTADERNRLAEKMVAARFGAILEAARDCDVVLGFAPLQVAARSVAEKLGLPYVYATHCPATLPSAHHAPPLLPGQSPAPGPVDNRALWEEDARGWQETFGAALNTQRVAAGLPPVSDVRSHIFTDRPWLAADPALGPWPEPGDGTVFQPGAWLPRDERPLSPELTAFLDAGAPPVYFGFGSMPAPQEFSRVVIEAARSLGHRVVLSHGWAGLSPIDDRPDCLAIGEANLRALFGRVAAVVHAGSSGTLTLAALAGAPQVVLPQAWDHFYWAERIDELGIGSAHAPGAPTVGSLAAALERALAPAVVARARAFPVRTDGAAIAAERLSALGTAARRSHT